MDIKSFILIAAAVIFLLLVIQCRARARDPETYGEMRRYMVESQIRARGVKDPKVLDAMTKVARHRFVPGRVIDQAYDDGPLPIGEGQTISQPYIVALMTELLGLGKNDRVLEIGTGSGYQAAVLAEICSVYTIEINETLGRRAEKLLTELGYRNIRVKIGDGYKGWPEVAPFDGIIVTCAPTRVPAPLKDQLAEGGRMVIPVGDGLWSQDLVLFKKTRGKLVKASIIPVRFVPMVDEKGKKY
jgi:protein-L-isoaspartate(D-aspartate) O-methyltransferase